MRLCGKTRETREHHACVTLADFETLSKVNPPDHVKFITEYYHTAIMDDLYDEYLPYSFFLPRSLQELQVW